MSEFKPLLPRYRRVIKLMRFTLSIISRTLYLAATVKSKPPEKRALYRAHLQQRACRKFLSIFGITVVSKVKQPREKEILSVSNHLGILDPFVIASLFPTVFSAKAEMGSWPVVGWISRTVGIIFVHRDRRMATSKFVQDVKQKMGEGVAVHAFPEGTTSDGSTVRQFKTGAFAALEDITNARVWPLAIVPVEINGFRVVDHAQASSLCWYDEQISLFQHFWGVLGLRSATYLVTADPPIETNAQSRKLLADRAHRSVLSMTKESRRDRATNRVT